LTAIFAPADFAQRYLAIALQTRRRGGLARWQGPNLPVNDPLGLPATVAGEGAAAAAWRTVDSELALPDRAVRNRHVDRSLGKQM
jgi:hypothetical protein